MKTTNALAWESEYKNPKFLTLGTEPLSDVREFAKWLRRKQKVDMADFAVLDLGCGNGKNLNYLVEEFAKSGIGYDISPTAVAHATRDAQVRGLGHSVRYEVRSIGDAFPLADESVDIVLDVTSSNSLNEKERAIYLSEVSRVLKTGGYFFVRALCKDGDTNAKNLIKESPGSEHDTYILPDVGVTERVFSKEDFTATYDRSQGGSFELLSLEKTSGYQKWGGQSYKRNYWIAYLRKPENA